MNYYGGATAIIKVGYIIKYILYRKGGKREIGYGRSSNITRPTTGAREY